MVSVKKTLIIHVPTHRPSWRDREVRFSRQTPTVPYQIRTRMSPFINFLSPKPLHSSFKIVGMKRILIINPSQEDSEKSASTLKKAGFQVMGAGDSETGFNYEL